MQTGVALPKCWPLKIISEQAHSNAKHDDVIKWRNFPLYWLFVRGIHRSPVISPHKGQCRGALMFSLIYASIIGWVNNREAGDVRHHCAHYDVVVMENINTHQIKYELSVCPGIFDDYYWMPFLLNVHLKNRFIFQANTKRKRLCADCTQSDKFDDYMCFLIISKNHILPEVAKPQQYVVIHIQCLGLCEISIKNQ